MSFKAFIQKIENKTNLSRFNIKDKFTMVKYDLFGNEMVRQNSYLYITSLFTPNRTFSDYGLKFKRSDEWNYIFERWAILNERGESFFAKDIPEEYIQR